MRILFLTHRIPYPPNKGDKIRAFHILSHLAQVHEVHLATLIDDAADLPGIAALGHIAKGVLGERIDQPGRKAFALREVMVGGSITVRHFYSKRLQARIDSLIDANDFDVILCSSSPMAEYVFRSRHADGRLAGLTKVMDLIDVDSYKWTQYSQRSPIWTAWIYRHEARALGKYEQQIAKAFDRLLVVSEQEKKFFPGSKPPENLRAISNGVDLGFFSPRTTSPRALPPLLMVFTGVMDYWPNIEGMVWFVDKVLPVIQKTVPGVALYIVGSRPSPEVLKLSAVPGVTVTGFVDDVRDYIGQASVCIAPLRIARGIQNKILEAMAMAKAVVTTPQAFEGVHAVAGSDIMVAEDELAFAAAVVSLLKDPEKATAMGRNARTKIEQYYSWDANLAPLEALLTPSAPSAHGTAH